MSDYPEVIIRAACAAHQQAKRDDRNEYDAMGAALAAADKARWKPLETALRGLQEHTLDCMGLIQEILEQSDAAMEPDETPYG